MEIFIFWIVVIIFLIGGYSFYLLRHSPRGFRLQVKLTILFFVLVLLPAIPLTMVVSGLLTQGVEIFLIPGVEESLDQSLDIIKMQLEERGLRFIHLHPDISDVDIQELNKFEISFYSMGEMRKGEPWMMKQLTTSDDVLPQLTPDLIRLLGEDHILSRMNTVREESFYEVYSLSPDSTIRVVGFELNIRILLAKNQIAESLKLYKSLSLFKESVIEGRLIWAIATAFILVLALLAILAARTLSRGISQPIQRLAHGMKNVSDGDLSARVEVQARDEIKLLVDSFNKMAEDLQSSQDKLVAAERIAAWRDIARRVSHEIRNSLTPIQISLHRIRTKYSTEELFLSLQDEIESLRRLAEEFSQFARMPQLNRQNSDLNLLIRHLIPLIEAESKPMKFMLQLDENINAISIDSDQIKRAIHNLVKNSIEASAVNGTILIRTSAIDDGKYRVQIEIRDHGSGMDDEIVIRIFEPYFTTKQRGVGLGLSIVKRIIDDHDGTIQIESKKAKGTKVCIKL